MYRREKADGIVLFGTNLKLWTYCLNKSSYSAMWSRIYKEDQRSVLCTGTLPVAIETGKFIGVSGECGLGESFIAHYMAN